MKLKHKKIISTVIGLVTLTAGTAAMAFYQENGFYFDSGFSVHKFHVAKKAKGVRIHGSKLFKDDNVGFDVVIGKRFSNVGAEVGFTVLGTQDFQRTVYSSNFKAIERFKHENTNFYVDFNNYFDLVDNLELKTAVGLGILQTKTKHNIYNQFRKKVVPEIKNSEAELKPRLGLGLQYNLTKTWSANIDMRYQMGNQYYQSLRSTGLNITYWL